jgi:delta 1-pyrroline-5-carboxylate dehydrogenase
MLRQEKRRRIGLHGVWPPSALSIDTTAAGGNATLLSLQEEG